MCISYDTVLRMWRGRGGGGGSSAFHGLQASCSSALSAKICTAVGRTVPYSIHTKVTTLKVDGHVSVCVQVHALLLLPMETLGPSSLGAFPVNTSIN
jgi:hypothetical protein